MDIKKYTKCRPFLCLRRGVSPLSPPSNDIRAFSLPTQRCFWCRRPHGGGCVLFSAYAEVFPDGQERARPSLAFLCLRRGVSPLSILPNSSKPFSLPTQRCFFLRLSSFQGSYLFSAYAEVFLSAEFWLILAESFSLPTQRCFRYATRSLPFFHLFSAYAEVFPACWASRFSWSAFLCLRRGVSYAEEGATLEWVFSLPTQRCFRPMKTPSARRLLFSAYAEVFPAGVKKGDTIEPFLCLRRGVSTGEEIVIPYPLTFLCLRRGVSIILCHIAFGATFSLPTQRCFLVVKRIREINALFSAYAEVFLSQIALSMMMLTFLCLRRGVSRRAPPPGTNSHFSLPTQRCFCPPSSG